MIKNYTKKPNGKNNTGRPDKYTPELLLFKAIEYFDSINDKSNYVDKGVNGKVPRPITLSGLCLYLGVSKDYISEKLKDEMFSETIKRIRLVVENNIEEGILLGIYNPTSGIFNLKNNFQRKDKTETEITGKDGGPIVVEKVIREDAEPSS